MKIINKVEEGKKVLVLDAKVGKVYKMLGGTSFFTPIFLCNLHQEATDEYGAGNMSPFIRVDKDFCTIFFENDEELEYVGELTLVIE